MLKLACRGDATRSWSRQLHQTAVISRVHACYRCELGEDVLRSDKVHLERNGHRQGKARAQNPCPGRAAQIASKFSGGEARKSAVMGAGPWAARQMAWGICTAAFWNKRNLLGNVQPSLASGTTSAKCWGLLGLELRLSMPDTHLIV